MGQPVVVYVCLALGVLAGLIGIGWMHYINTHGQVVKTEHPEGTPRTIKEKIVWFVKHLLIEVIALVFTIFGIVGLETNRWGSLDMQGIRIAFFVFTAVKYCLVIAVLYMEHWETRVPGLRERVSYNLHIRIDWPEISEALIFIPMILIDGLIINAEYTLGDIGDIFPYDGVILIVLDVLMYVKMMLFFILKVWTEDYTYAYDIKNIVFSCLSFLYTLFLIFLVVVVHLNEVFVTGMAPTRNFGIALCAALTHFYISSYSSMIAQNILFLDKLLKKGDQQARLNQLLIFIKYFRHNDPLWILINIACYGFTLYLYISVLAITGHLFSNRRPEVFIQACISTLLLFITILTAFFIANWVFAVLKRIGVFIGCRSPFDCTTYAQAVNLILSQCRANFVMDTAMQVRNK
eukprot:gb/GEZN01008134.1/.p1 GENE.gb/GEZN01008134.1/~~gb/GEZN01008134.1/.p1  ORF type:complete len:406 (+),score=-12.26 gb/GEZN01008134.1/:223-1440(+)